MTVICELLGMAEKDRDQFRHGSSTVMKGTLFTSDDEYIDRTPQPDTFDIGRDPKRASCA